MLSLLRKKKVHDAVKENATQERTANRIVSACILFQKKWADRMQCYTESLSGNGKLIMFSLICLLGGSLSLYWIVSSITHQPVSFTITQFKAVPFARKSGDENTKAVIIVTKADYKKMQHFRYYMDSLFGSASGKKTYDSILQQRPGLMDSIVLLENIYHLQSSKK